jgi:hypothetical protein
MSCQPSEQHKDAFKRTYTTKKEESQENRMNCDGNFLTLAEMAGKPYELTENLAWAQCN